MVALLEVYWFERTLNTLQMNENKIPYAILTRLDAYGIQTPRGSSTYCRPPTLPWVPGVISRLRNRSMLSSLCLKTLMETMQ